MKTRNKVALSLRLGTLALAGALMLLPPPVQADLVGRPLSCLLGSWTNGNTAMFDAAGRCIDSGRNAATDGAKLDNLSSFSIGVAGTTQTIRGRLNFAAGATCADNSGTNSNDCTISPATVGAAASASGRATLTGPTASRSYALPDADATILTTSVSGKESWIVLCGSAAGANDAGNVTTENALATCNLPSAALGPNGRIRITAHWSHTNSANNKTLRIRWNGSGCPSACVGTAVFTQVDTTTVQVAAQITLANRNSNSSQVYQFATASIPFSTQTSAVTTDSVNTASGSNVPILLTCQKATGTESCILENYTVELAHGS